MQRSFYSLLAVVVFATMGYAQPVTYLKKWLATNPGNRPVLRNEAAAHVGLTRQEADEATALLLNDERTQRADALKKSWADKSLTEGEHVMKFEYRLFGEKPADGRSLFISLHGGGNAKPEVNDQQWKNQIGLYKPAEGFYVAPVPPPIPGTSGTRRTSIRYSTS